MRKENLAFEDAIKAVKEGKRITRTGWNGKGMFLWYKPEAIIKEDWCKDQILKEIASKNGGEIKALGTICMFTAQKEIVSGWAPSQADMQSVDWIILD